MFRWRTGIAATLGLLIVLPRPGWSRPGGGTRPEAPAVAWRDLTGKEYGAAAGCATVLVFGSTRCPCADGYTSRVLRLAEEYGPRQVRFFLVFSAPDVPRPEIETYVRSRRLSFPAVQDGAGELAKRFGAAATPTAVLLGTKGQVCYQGRIDDSPEPVAVRREYLREALEATLAGRPVALARTAAIGCSIGAGQEKKEERDARPVALVEGIGEVRFPVTTRSPEAQRYFNQGMARWFGFNFPEAERSFREAARRDPNCAMAYWGIALSLGMTYNFDNDPARLPEAVEAVRKAAALAEKATPKEQALIRALGVRHAKPEQALEPYRAAMGRVYYHYVDDPNVAVLYAASIMDLHPWALWTPDGQPQPGTLEALLVLEDAMRRDANHLGAHHYYIHATEASPHPERALPSARKLANLAPQSGHLVHMPAHTFQRVGDYLNSAASNSRAAGVDNAYYAAVGMPTRYAMYYIHNLDFLIAAELMEGRSAPATEAARELAEVTTKLAPDEAPFWCGTASGALAVYARCGKWDAILRAAAPPEANPFKTTYWRYGRGMGYVAKRDLPAAERELRELEKAAAAAQAAVPPIPVPGFVDAMKKSFGLTVPVLAGKIALARGDSEAALRHFREGVAMEDSMPYLEPVTWRYPVREALGGALLKLGRPAEAEAVFRDDLQRNRNNGRSLFGLMTALDRQGKKEAAAQVRAQYQEAWKRADVRLNVDEL
jgi:tetratricopeptide (TPR) repeat protein